MATVTKDPVCGMELNIENTEEHSEYGGGPFTFAVINAETNSMKTRRST